MSRSFPLPVVCTLQTKKAGKWSVGAAMAECTPCPVLPGALWAPGILGPVLANDVHVATDPSTPQIQWTPSNSFNQCSLLALVEGILILSELCVTAASTQASWDSTLENNTSH